MQSPLLSTVQGAAKAAMFSRFSPAGDAFVRIANDVGPSVILAAPVVIPLKEIADRIGAGRWRS